MKKVIFFDGDGTLWYPESTKRTVAPHWVYFDPMTMSNPWAEFVATPTVAETLRRLGDLNIKRVLLSTSPLPEEEAIMSRIKAAQQIDVHHLLDDIQIAPDYPSGKGERLVALLERYGLGARDALMVGDTYERDYQAARDVGIDSLLLRSEYQQEFIEQLPANQVITDLIEVLGHVDLNEAS